MTLCICVRWKKLLGEMQLCSELFLQICTSMLRTKNLLLGTHLPHEFCLTTFSDLGSWFSLGNLILTLKGASKKIKRTTNHKFNIHMISILLLFRPLYISYSCERLNNSLNQFMRCIILCNFIFFFPTGIDIKENYMFIWFMFEIGNTKNKQE